MLLVREAADFPLRKRTGHVSSNNGLTRAQRFTEILVNRVDPPNKDLSKQLTIHQNTGRRETAMVPRLTNQNAEEDV